VDELRKKVGQMFMVGLAGNALKKEELAILRDCPFGGFVLFKHNCSSAEQIRALCDSLWNTARDLPPFIAIDQEGGNAHRLPKPFTHFPSAARIGESGDPTLAYRAGRAAAAELALVGINLNFAPVLDVNSNPNNPVIGDRSFAADPRQVIEFSQPWIQGTRDAGIIPCGKHFPGHGDTDKDSHIDLPSVDKSLDQLRAVELPPFAQACCNRIESLMTAHVLYRALDGEFPATLSVAIVTNLLREELRYDGLVFSDALEMKAISDNYGDNEAGALCIRAGVDVLLRCQQMPSVADAFEFLCNVAEKDPTIRDRVENSYRRIATLKRRYLKSFNAAPKNEVVEGLSRLDHKRIVEQIYGSL
jgi:beta-N-acetylhexosaminidase